MIVTQANENRALVSVVMPAYKAHYLPAALESVRLQSYRPLELVVCDDCRTDDVRTIVEQFAREVDFPVRYQHNETRLNEMRNLARCIELAQGDYIKPLYDDDLMQPECVGSLLALMQSNPDVSLASSRRRRIDPEGQPLPDILATAYPFAGDALVDGEQLVSLLAEHTLNFIGEPSTVMCRRADLLPMGDQLSVLNGKRIPWVGDLALYVKLLRQGRLAMLAEPLTDFRVSLEQFSQKGRDQPGIGDQGHADFRQAIRDLGWHRGDSKGRMVDVAPITRVKTRVFKPVDIVAALYKAAGQGGVSLSTWLQARRPSSVQMTLIEQRLQAHAGGPRIGVLVLDRDASAAAVEKTLLSLEVDNLYRSIDVRVLSSSEAMSLQGRTGQVATVVRDAWVETVNGVVAELPVDWVMLVEAGTQFTPSGLLMTALELTAAGECSALYGDELVRDDSGGTGVALRPDFSLDLLLSFPASAARHWLFRRESLLELGGFDVGFDQAFELEYILRLIENGGLSGLGHVSEPLLSADAFALKDNPQEREVIERHLRARGYQNPSVASRQPGRYQLEYAHGQQPLVSILIPFTDQLGRLQRCVETLLENTAYPHYELLLLDLGSEQQATLDWLQAIEQIGKERIRVLHFAKGTSRPLAGNAGMDYVQGEMLLWLGAGAGIVAGDWLAQLLNHALRPEVGAVGAKLLSADGRIHHAGLLLGLRGPAGKAFEGLELDDAGYMQRLQVEQNYSALSGECLMIRRELFVELGGFDPEPLLERWFDVDLCLKARQAGYLNVWTPRVQLLMDSQISLPASNVQEDAMYARWLPTLARDPAYNPGFSLQAEQGFKLADPQLAWRPLQAWRPIPTVLAHPADLYGCGHYRVIQPFTAMKEAGLIDGALSIGLLHVTDLERYEPDVILLQRQIGEARLEAMRRMKAFSRAFKVYELDDYLPNLPLKNAHRQHMPKDILRSLRRGVDQVDRFVVSTAPLAEAFAGLHADIRVIENRLPAPWWSGLQSRRRISSRPRVGWAGGVSHTGDLEMILDVVKELATEVDWVFFGMCPDALRPYVKEVHTGVEISKYPQALASLDLDLAIAPVEQNLFNECKSNLRLLEYGACGFPVVCSDVLCYQDGLPVTRVKNRYRDWVDAIRLHINDLDACARAGDELRAVVMRDWVLEGDKLLEWRRAWLPD